VGLRPESSVSVVFDEWGVMGFAGDRPSPVVHRTPEELGIPRVIPPDPPRRLSVWPSEWPAESARTARSYAERFGQKRLKSRSETVSLGAETVELRTIRGVEVRMPANAQMGAEMIDLIAKEENDVNKYDLEEAANRKIVAAPVSTPAAVLAAELGVAISRVYGVRSMAYRTGKLIKRSASDLGKAAHRGTAAKKAVAVRTIEVDAKRPGTASALINALARRDAATAVTVRLELTEGEVVGLIAKLSGEQRAAFLAAGIKAAILG
jgi:hypothetical protein